MGFIFGQKIKQRNINMDKVTEKTSAGLCDALFDEFDLLRNGLSDPHQIGRAHV